VQTQFASPVHQRRLNRPRLGVMKGVHQSFPRHTTGKELELAEGALKHGRYGAERPARRTLAECERGHILQTLTDTNWVVGGRDGAAARLGIARTTLIHKMKKLRIEPGAPEALAASV
jgi:transcriptional regulator with GAF, ATPase, and Fis domain